MRRIHALAPAVLCLLVGCAAATAPSAQPPVPSASPSAFQTQGAGPKQPAASVAAPATATALAAPITGGPASSPVVSASAGAPHDAVTEKDFFIALASDSVAAGAVTFDVTNNGPSMHTFVVVKTNLAADKLPTIGGDVDATGLSPIGQLTDVEPGTTGSLTVTLAPGHYVIYCALSGHYFAGMRHDLTVP